MWGAPHAPQARAFTLAIAAGRAALQQSPPKRSTQRGEGERTEVRAGADLPFPSGCHTVFAVKVCAHLHGALAACGRLRTLSAALRRARRRSRALPPATVQGERPCAPSSPTRSASRCWPTANGRMHRRLRPAAGPQALHARRRRHLAAQRDRPCQPGPRVRTHGPGPGLSGTRLGQPRRARHRARPDEPADRAGPSLSCRQAPERLRARGTLGRTHPGLAIASLDAASGGVEALASAWARPMDRAATVAAMGIARPSPAARRTRVLHATGGRSWLSIEGRRCRGDGERVGVGRTMSQGSSFMRRKFAEIGKQLRSGPLVPEPGKETLASTRAQVTADWRTTAEALRKEGQRDLALQVEQFVRAMQPVRTDNEHIAARWVAHVLASRRTERMERNDRDDERSR